LFFSLPKIALATGFLKRFAHRPITYPSNQWRRNGIAPRNKKKQQTDFTGTKTKLENKTKKQRLQNQRITMQRAVVFPLA